MYGFDMTPLRNVVIGDAIIDTISADKIVTDAYLLKVGAYCCSMSMFIAFLVISA